MATHRDLKAVEEFLTNKTYPKGILKDKGKKSNITKACKNFSIVNGDLMYKEKRRVVFEVERRSTIIHNVHKEIGDNSKVMSLRTKKFLNDFSGMAQLKTLRNTLKFVKVANDAMRVDASSNPPVSCLKLL